MKKDIQEVEQTRILSNNENLFLKKLPALKVAKGRLVFKNKDDFSQILDILFNSDNEEIKKWEKQEGFTSLRKSKEIEENTSVSTVTIGEDFKFPVFYAAILNQNLEYQIGDSIIAYYKGFRLAVHTDKEKSLELIKLNINDLESFKEVSVIKVPKPQRIEANDNISSNGRAEYAIRLSANQFISRFCYYYRGGLDYKIEKTLWNFFTFSNSTSFLYTQIKLEYYQNGKWRTAGETANKNISNFYIYAQIQGGSTIINLSNQSRSQNNNNDLTFPLGSSNQGTAWDIDYAYGNYKTVVPSHWNGVPPCTPQPPCLSCLIGYEECRVIWS